MSHETITIATSDGECQTHVLTPVADDGGPAIVMYMDGGGIRPAMLGMGQRLADAGYVVLLPDLFYRFGPYGPFDLASVFKSDFRAVLGPLMATTSNAASARDTAALLAYLDSRSDIVGDRVGAVGFCMGGGMAIAAAGTYPDRFGAVATFHGGRLATDAADSPHTYAPRLEASVYIAAAQDDPSYPTDMAAHLEKALADAQVDYRTETYAAAHGWMMPDFPVYDEREAERGWSELSSFLSTKLR